MGVLAVPYFMGDPIDPLEISHPHDTLDAPVRGSSPQERMAVLVDLIASWVERDRTPVVYAGDCVASIGVAAGLQRRNVRPTVIWFDAHGDFHTWETTRSQFIGGMPLAMLTGRGEDTIIRGAGLAPVPDDRVWLVGARDLDPGEDEALAASDVHMMTVRQFAHHDLPPDPLLVHIDVDIVDPMDMPAVNYSAADGPSVKTVRRAMIHLAATGHMAAVSISTWNPAMDGADRAAEATAYMIEPLLA
jgi:arginase